MSDACLFCRIVRREIPARVVREDEHLLAFRDVSPQAPVHVLVIPKAHVGTMNEIGDFSLVGRMAQMAAEIAKAEGIAQRGYRLVVNTNVEGGQTVFHLHLHLLGGRSMAWPPG